MDEISQYAVWKITDIKPVILSGAKDLLFAGKKRVLRSAQDDKQGIRWWFIGSSQSWSPAPGVFRLRFGIITAGCI